MLTPSQNTICLTVLYQLDKAKGLDIGNTYVNDKKAKEFVHHISNVSRKETLQLLANSKYISVTCDGTSDFMGEEYESLYVHSCMDGKVTDSFFGLGEAVGQCFTYLFLHQVYFRTEQC
jgi:hypothetical protein